MAAAPSATRGKTVSYVGYQGLPTVPLDVGQVLDPCIRETANGPCTVAVEKLVSVAGDSGAPLFTDDGHIVAFVINQEGSQGIRAIRIDEVKRIASAYGIPWTLYTAIEEETLGRALNVSIAGDDRRTVEQFLARYFDIDREYDVPASAAKYFPIVQAARLGRYDTVKRLIEHGARQTAVAGRLSIRDGRTDVIELLILKHRDISCALAAALEAQQLGVARRILRAQLAGTTYDINEVCERDQTALFLAIKTGDEALVSEILRQGGNAEAGHIDRVFRRGFPLTAAILGKQDQMVHRLLERGARADAVEYPAETLPPGLDGTDFRIFGPLHAAAYMGNMPLMDVLIQRGAKPDVHTTVSEGQTVTGGSPFEAALLGGQLAAAEHLRARYGVSPFGYRFRGILVKEIRSSALPAQLRARAELLINRETAPYCAGLARSQFEFPRDYEDQRSRC
jgi:hypothetical protein